MAFEINGPEDLHKLVLTPKEFKEFEKTERKRVFLSKESVEILQQGLVLLLEHDPEITAEYQRKIELLGYGLTDVKDKFK